MTCTVIEAIGRVLWEHTGRTLFTVNAVGAPRHQGTVSIYDDGFLPRAPLALGVRRRVSYSGPRSMLKL